MEPQLFWEIYSSFDYLGCNAAAIMLNSTSNNKSGHNTAQNFEGGLFRCFCGETLSLNIYPFKLARVCSLIKYS